MTHDSSAEKHFRRNYLLGITNGAFFGFVDALVAPSLVLALFVAQLGGSDILIGLLPSIYNGGWFLPQFLVSHRIQRLPLKKRLYQRVSVFRIITLALLAFATPLIGAGHPQELLLVFFIIFTTYSLLSGLGGNVFMTMVGKVIPTFRRGSFFGIRDLSGTALGLVAGYIVASLLGPNSGLSFPNNFAVIFFIIFVAATIGLTSFGFVVEPVDKVTEDQTTLKNQFSQARRVWNTDHTFRRYLSARLVIAVADVATPFYAIFATRHLGAPAAIVGLYIGLTTLSALVTNPLLSWLSDHRGNRLVLLIAATAAAVMPLVALTIGLLAPRAELATALGALFLIYGAGRTAANIAFPTFLLEIAPAAQRPLYIGFTNTLLGIATFIPAVGGILLDLFGFNVLFSLAIVLSLLGLWLAVGMNEPRTRPL